jgi:VCBS repeat-containing protein
VNDAPVALGEAYSIAAGATLTVAAPGVLANDADVEGAALLASVAVPPAHGTLALAASGGFTYTSAAGYSGPDSFTYRASDGGLASAPVAVDLTITGSTPATLFTASFAATAESFTYLDNTFRGAIQSSYATGSYVSSGGFSGGALRIYLGGINNNTINGMSGGWRRTFAMSSAAAATLTFRYRLHQGPDYESDERSEVLASLDGVLVTGTSVDYVARVTGNGNGGASIDTGWRQVTIDLGMLPAGTHALTLGGYNSRKNTTSERTTIWIDDVNVTIR